MALVAPLCISDTRLANADGLFVIHKGGFEFPADVLVVKFPRFPPGVTQSFKGPPSSASVGQ